MSLSPVREVINFGCQILSSVLSIMKQLYSAFWFTFDAGSLEVNDYN